MIIIIVVLYNTFVLLIIYNQSLFSIVIIVQLCVLLKLDFNIVFICTCTCIEPYNYIIIIIIHVLFYCVWDFLVGGVYHLCILCVHIDWLYTPRVPCLHSLFATHIDPCPNWLMVDPHFLFRRWVAWHKGRLLVVQAGNFYF